MHDAIGTIADTARSLARSRSSHRVSRSACGLGWGDVAANCCTLPHVCTRIGTRICLALICTSRRHATKNEQPGRQYFVYRGQVLHILRCPLVCLLPLQSITIHNVFFPGGVPRSGGEFCSRLVPHGVAHVIVAETSPCVIPTCTGASAAPVGNDMCKLVRHIRRISASGTFGPLFL